ncbi:MAG: hypothetical protein KF861_19015, partial [Planctomycetaceae bacterium]|nr:hypothetical protein [Planctomycetaceae bacterium]
FRFRSKQDRRKSVLMLTERGRDLAEAIDRIQGLEAEAVVAVLDAGQRTNLMTLVARLHNHLDASPQILISSLDDSAGDDWASDSESCSPATAAESEQPVRRAS